jgi:hypothetical protein
MRQVVHRRPQCFIEAHPESHERHDTVRSATTLGHLAATGAGRRSPAIVGVVACTDDRRITHPSRIFPRPARSAHGSGDIAVSIARKEVDRPMRRFA